MRKENRLSETVFYKKVIDELSKILVKEYELTNDEFHIVRIESPSIPGVPDINVCIKGVDALDRQELGFGIEFWIECKVYPGVLGSYQIAWKKKRELAGGRVFVITYIHDNRVNLLMNHAERVCDSIYTAIKDILHNIGL